MPLVALDRVSIAYGHLPLLDEVSLQIDPRERVSVIGRNGTGKSTLLKIISGEAAADSGAVVFVTHDRAFLQRLATRIIELDRGQLTSWPGDYETYLRRKEDSIANETVGRAKFDRKLADEEAWLRQGVKARRTRDEGRVRALMAMRAERAARREQIGAVQLEIEQAEPSGKLVFEARRISKAYAATPIV